MPIYKVFLETLTQTYYTKCGNNPTKHSLTILSSPFILTNTSGSHSLCPPHTHTIFSNTINFPPYHTETYLEHKDRHRMYDNICDTEEVSLDIFMFQSFELHDHKIHHQANKHIYIK